MKIPRTITASGAAATALAFARPLRAMAETGPAPAGTDVVVSDPFDPRFFIGLGMLVAVAVLVAVVAIRRPRSRRPIAALLMVVISGVVALTFVLAALLSDWSGQHRISPFPLVVGIAVLIVGLYVAVGIFRGSSEERGS